MIVAFLTPAVLFFLVIFVYPILRTILMSFFEIEGVSYEIAKEALRLAAQKLPVTTKFIVRRDYDKNA